MLNRKSIYSLNKKDPDAIVYMDAERNIVRLTREDFDTEADFLKWKSWSDENYHDTEKNDHVEANHTTPISERIGAVDGPEIVIERRIEKLEQERYTSETVIRVRGQLRLLGFQVRLLFRRIWLRYVDGLAVEDIAQLEGKAHSSISESISRARKKVVDFFSKHPTKGV